MAGYGGAFKLWLAAFIVVPMIVVYAVGHPVNTHDNGVITFGDEASANSIPVTFDPSRNTSGSSGSMASTPSNASNTVNAVKLTLMVRMENNRTAVEVKTIENMAKPTGASDQKTDNMSEQTDNKHKLSTSSEVPPQRSENVSQKNESFPAQTVTNLSKLPEMPLKPIENADRKNDIFPAQAVTALSKSPEMPLKHSENATQKNDSFPAQTITDLSKSPEMPLKPSQNTAHKNGIFPAQTVTTLSKSPEMPLKHSENATQKNDSFPAQTVTNLSKSLAMQSKGREGAGRPGTLLESPGMNVFDNQSAANQTVVSSPMSFFANNTPIDIVSEKSSTEKKDDDWKEEYVAAIEKVNNTQEANTPTAKNGQPEQIGNRTVLPRAHQLDRNNTDFEDTTKNATDKVPEFAADLEIFSDGKVDLYEANETVSEPPSATTAAQDQHECEDDPDETEGSGDEDSVICEGTEKDDTEDAGMQIEPDNKGVPNFVSDSDHPLGTIIGLDHSLNGHLKDVTNGDEVITIWINLRTGQIVGSTLKSLNKAERALMPVMGKDHVGLLSERLKRDKKGKLSSE